MLVTAVYDITVFRLLHALAAGVTLLTMHLQQENVHVCNLNNDFNSINQPET